MIHHYNHETLVVLVLFTVPVYHFSFSRYLELAERHFSSDIWVPFPDSGVLYNRAHKIHIRKGYITNLTIIFTTNTLKCHSSKTTKHIHMK